jgi:hypothetical protein
MGVEGVEYLGEVLVEVFAVPSRTEEEPRIVQRFPLGGDRGMWTCSCPASLNPDYKHRCYHIDRAKEKRALRWAPELT